MSRPSEVRCWDSLLTADGVVQDMMAELHRVYSAKSKAFGEFNEESELADALKLLRKAKKNFVFQPCDDVRLKDELAKYPFAEGGVVLFVNTVTSRSNTY